MSNQEKKIGILNLEMGNIASVINAIEYCGYDTQVIPYKEAYAQLKDSKSVSHLIIPGVGHYQQAMDRIQSTKLKMALYEWVQQGYPLLGICLGMQLLCEASEERFITAEEDHRLLSDGNKMAEGLSILPGLIKRLEGPERLPHIGWNSVDFLQPHPVLEGLKSDKDYYFVHTYGHVETNPEVTLATTDYNGKFSSMLAYKSAIGIQFHPEKSQRNGLQILENFCGWSGES